MSVEVKII